MMMKTKEKEKEKKNEKKRKRMSKEKKKRAIGSGEMLKLVEYLLSKPEVPSTHTPAGYGIPHLQSQHWRGGDKIPGA